MDMETDNKLKMTPAMSAAVDENALLLGSLHKVTQDLLTTQQTLTATETELSTTQEDLFHTADQLIQANNSVQLLQTEVNDLRAEKLNAITNNNKNKKGKKQQQQEQDPKLAFQKWLNDNKPPSILRAKLKQRSPTDKDVLIKKLQRELASKESRSNIQRTQLNELRKELNKEKEYSALLNREGSRLLTQKCDLELVLNEIWVENRALKDKNKFWAENRALKRESRVLRKRNRALKDNNRVLKNLLGDGIVVTKWYRLGKDRREQYREWREKVDGLIEGAGDGDEDDDEIEDVGVNMDEEAYVEVNMDEDEDRDGEGFWEANEAGVRNDNGDGDRDGENQVEEQLELQVVEQVEEGKYEVEDRTEEGANQREHEVEPKDEDADGEEGRGDDGGKDGGDHPTGCKSEDHNNDGDGNENGDGDGDEKEDGKEDGNGDRARDGNKDQDESTKADEAVYSESRLELSI